MDFKKWKWINNQMNFNCNSFNFVYTPRLPWLALLFICTLTSSAQVRYRFQSAFLLFPFMVILHDKLEMGKTESHCNVVLSILFRIETQNLEMQDTEHPQLYYEFHEMLIVSSHQFKLSSQSSLIWMKMTKNKKF